MPAGEDEDMTRTQGDGAGKAVRPAVVPPPDGDEIAQFWHLARGRAGLGRLAVLIGTGSRAGVPPVAWAFADTPDEADRLLGLVLDGRKTATTTALWELEDAGQAPPAPGDLAIVVDGRGHPRALLRTTAVRTVRLADVDADHARRDAEGDGSLESWTAACTAYLRAAGAASGRAPTPDTAVVLETFEVRFPPRRRARR